MSKIVVFLTSLILLSANLHASKTGLSTSVQWRILEETTVSSEARIDVAPTAHIERGILTHAIPKHRIIRSMGNNDTLMYQDIQTTSYGQLRQLLGENILSVDSITVIGPIDETDIYTLWEASFNGKLKIINIERAEVKNSVIPENAFWHQSEQLDPSWEFINCINLRKIILPDDIVEIGKMAFSYAINLESINMPKSLKVMELYAFSDCVSLNVSPLVFPEGFEKIKNLVFLNCRELTGEIVLPSTIKEIGDGAFFQSKISSINLPEGLQRIGDAAFYACRLQNVVIPESCVDIEYPMVFQMNYDLESIHLPEGIETIPSSFVSTCLKLREINIPTTVTHIKDYGLWQCRSIRELALPDKLESIGTVGLWYCDSLERIVFPATFNILGAESCKYWTNIREIYCAAVEPPICMESNTNPGHTPFGSYGSTFELSTPSDIPVYVPIGSAEKYRKTWGWDYFSNFIETDSFPSASIDNVSIDSKSSVVYYDLFGRICTNPIPGHLYIRGDGKKVLYRAATILDWLPAE